MKFHVTYIYICIDFSFDINRDCDEQPDQTSTNNKHCCSSRKKNYDRFIPWKVIGPFASKEVNHPLLVMVRKYYAEAICLIFL